MSGSQLNSQQDGHEAGKGTGHENELLHRGKDIALRSLYPFSFCPLVLGDPFMGLGSRLASTVMGADTPWISYPLTS